MSQHHLDTKSKDGQNVNLVIGWDRPVFSYFARVINSDQQTIFDTLGINYTGPQQIDDLDEFLNYLPIDRNQLPSEMIEKLYLEAAFNEQTGFHRWSSDGVLLEHHNNSGADREPRTENS